MKPKTAEVCLCGKEACAPSSPNQDAQASTIADSRKVYNMTTINQTSPDTAKSGSKKKRSGEITLTRADNAVIMIVNGTIIDFVKTEGDPLLDKRYDISRDLRSGPNDVTIIGLDWGGRSHVRGGITINGEFTEFWHLQEGTPGGVNRSYDRTFHFTLT